MINRQFKSSATSLPQPVTTESVNLKPELMEIIKTQTARTKFERSRIEFYLPLELKDIFKRVNSTGGRLYDNEKGRKLIAFVETDIFGAIPDYYSPATVEQANGIIVNGKILDIHMAREVARRQMAMLASRIEINHFTNAVEPVLAEKYGIKMIKDTIFGNGAMSHNRQVVASILAVGEKIIGGSPQ